MLNILYAEQSKMVMEMLFFAIHLRKINSITIASQSQINRTNFAIAIAIINMTCDYLFCDCDSLKLPRCDAIGSPGGKAGI